MCEAGTAKRLTSVASARLLCHGLLTQVICARCRSASRIGQSDGDINRKRIKALRLELQKKGWKSIGY